MSDDPKLNPDDTALSRRGFTAFGVAAGVAFASGALAAPLATSCGAGASLTRRFCGW